MLGNTIVLTINGTAETLTLVNTGESYSGEYRKLKTLEEFRLRIRHQVVTKGGLKYERHNWELTRTVFATTTLPEYTNRTSRVHEVVMGTSAVDLAAALAAWETASSNSILGKIEGGES